MKVLEPFYPKFPLTIQLKQPTLGNIAFLGLFKS